MKDNLPPSEGKIQSECYIWFHNTYPEHRGRLYAINNNSHNAIKGSFNKAMGVVSGVSDMHFILPEGRILFIEMKDAKGVQSEAQKKWQATAEGLGHKYVIIRTLKDFQELIKNLLLGIAI